MLHDQKQIPNNTRKQRQNQEKNVWNIILSDNDGIKNPAVD